MLSKWMVNSRIGLTMLSKSILRKRRPISIQILVTKYCDMTCNMCFTYPIDSKDKMKHSPEPTFQQLEYLIEESCKMGAQVIIPFGGEPLIRKDIGEIINLIKKRNRYCILYTNGTYLHQRIDEIKQTDQLVISIDGNENTHDSIRGQGSYKKCIEGLELALSKNFVTRLHTVLTLETLDSLPHMIELSKKFDVMLNYGYTDATALTKPVKDQFVPNRDQVIEFLQKYLEAKKSGVRISSPVSSIEECIRVMKEWPIDGHTLTRNDAKAFSHLQIPKCGLFTSNLYIDSDGRAYPCLPLWGAEGHGPNVYEVGLKTAWDHYSNLNCYQCASVFTIEKGLFYNFRLAHVLQFLEGFGFLRSEPRRSLQN
ncbi:hypothetical protein UR09_04580 [Candidatus Nitromaritima sp. SCGC AAA799-A02]|nr:hypothetical protein UR09_04580 [Candidatus Nitromaritima sp. SCGC AAA799-A02]